MHNQHIATLRESLVNVAEMAQWQAGLTVLMSWLIDWLRLTRKKFK